jgi:carboxypeptidase Taq
LDLEKKIEKGEFMELKNWLNEKIHQQGNSLNFDDLVSKVTGEKLNPDHFIEYAKKKYSNIYLE